MINLLPPIEKLRRNQEKNLKVIWNIGILIIFSLITFSCLLLIVKIYLSNQIEIQQALIENEKNNSQQVQELKKRVDAINTTLGNLNEFYQDYTSSTELFEQIEVLLPENIYLDTYLYYGDMISLSGYGDSVETIHEFRSNLRDSFAEVDLRLSDWLETETINFRVEFKLNES